MDSTTPETSEATDQRAFRLNITIKPETKVRLDEARNRRGVDMNVSQVCDRAINAELDRSERPGLADVLSRLRIESDRRRGVPYKLGHVEGTKWAREIGSWAEICDYARLGEDDVVLGDVTWRYKEGGKVSGTALGFLGSFAAPREDYPLNSPNRFGAPGFVDDDDRCEIRPHLCDQYWRGWLAGVKEVFSAVSEDLQPIFPTTPASSDDVHEKLSPLLAGEIDPDDIPF
jgi:hypothetical protein